MASGSKNLDLINRLKAIECPDATYRPKDAPLVMERAKGSEVYDADGKRYIDFCAGFGALPLGHNAAPLLDVCSQYVSKPIPPIEHAMGDVYPSTAKIDFLETMKSCLPKSMAMGAVALSGGQSCELALKTALLKTKKAGFIAFEQCYHGLDLGVLPLTFRHDFKDPFSHWFPDAAVVHLPFNCKRETLKEAIRNLSSTSAGFAGVIVEPLQGRAGVIVPDDGWLKSVVDETHENQGVVIFDEVFTGFGRTGRFTYAEELTPDLVAFGKAIGGGFPISALFGTAETMSAWPESPGEALHTGTFFGHPFSAAVGAATMRAIRDQNLCHRSKALGRKIMSELQSWKISSSKIKSIRGQGLMIGIEFNELGFAAAIMNQARAKGLIVLPSGPTSSVLSITPSLNISESLVDEGLEIVRSML
jgi:4-aminobutyrate aminotransferase-like enzyme